MTEAKDAFIDTGEMFVLAASLMLLPAALAPMQEREGHALARGANPIAVAQGRLADPVAGDENKGGAARMASSEGSSQRRVQPRVSKTRCAFVTCGARCEIKGSRDEQGALIYRMPGSPAYRQARADRMFCNTAEAKVAGYREAERS